MTTMAQAPSDIEFIIHPGIELRLLLDFHKVKLRLLKATDAPKIWAGQAPINESLLRRIEEQYPGLIDPLYWLNKQRTFNNLFK
jgi:hypothetical protein